MLYTFGQAIANLTVTAPICGALGAREAINTAIDALAASDNWTRLRRTIRFNMRGSVLALPQQYKTMVRACIGTSPVLVHGPEFEFLNGGPGTLDSIPAGYAEMSGFSDTGFAATQYDPDAPAQLIAFSAQDNLQLRVTGENSAGERITEKITVQQWTGPDSLETATVDATPTTALFATIESISVDPSANQYLYLYTLATTDNESKFLAKFHPAVRVPEFRRYTLPGTQLDKDYRVTAEVTLNVMPLVSDDDILPFDSLIPLQEMLQSLWYTRNGELKSAVEYQQLAVSHLKQRETQELRRTEVVVENYLYETSGGSISHNAFNI